MSAVARGDADMAIVDGALHYDLQIEAKPLFREGFFLVVPKTVALTEPVEATTLHVQDEILIYGQPEIQQWHDYWFGVDARPLRRRGDTSGGPAGADTGSGGHHLVLSSERDTPFGVSLSVVLCRILSLHVVWRPFASIFVF